MTYSRGVAFMTLDDKELWLKKHGTLYIDAEGVSVWTTRGKKAKTVSSSSTFSAIINDLYDDAIDDLFARCYYYDEAIDDLFARCYDDA